MGKTAIEWTDESSNPIKFHRKDNKERGWACVKMSDGCLNCYSERRNQWIGTKLGYSEKNLSQVESFIDEKEVNRLFRLGKSRKIFAFNMTDFFGDFISDHDRLYCLAVMALCQNQTFQVLTKRAWEMFSFFSEPNIPLYVETLVEEICGERGWCGIDLKWPLPNLWLGTTIENQKAADERIPLLLQTPAAVRFVSCEPLLGPVDLGIGVCPVCGGCGETAGHYFQEDGMDTCDACGGNGKAIDKVGWVICGGESGPGARPMHPDWARSLRDQCVSDGVPFFFKQWGEWHPEFPERDGEPTCPVCNCTDSDPCEGGCYWVGDSDMNDRCSRCSGYKSHKWPDGTYSYRIGKKAAGRELDGRTWDEFPKGR